MKKARLLFLLVLMLSACAPAQNPNSAVPTEMAVEVKTDPPTPTTVVTWQRYGTVTFEYYLTRVIPQDWIIGMVDTEEIRFERQSDGSWSTEKATPVMKDMGPLFFDLVWEDLTTVNGGCGINTYYASEPWGEISFQPVCNEIGENERVRMTFGLENCERDVADNLTCKRFSSNGTLYYQLSPELQKFQFTFDGVWNFEYANWIRESLGKLGFKPIPDNFFDTMVPGASLTIYKE